MNKLRTPTARSRITKEQTTKNLIKLISPESAAVPEIEKLLLST